MSTMNLGYALGNNQPQPGPLLLIELAVELHVGTNIGDLLAGQATPMIADLQDTLITILARAYNHLFAGFREFECVIDQFINHFFR